jgi:hypothetical protein
MKMVTFPRHRGPLILHHVLIPVPLYVYEGAVLHMSTTRAVEVWHPLQ